MQRRAVINDRRFESLRPPFRNTGGLIVADPETVMRQGAEFFGSGTHGNRGDKIIPQAEMSSINLGKTQILAVRSTPCRSRQEGDGSVFTLAMPCDGESVRFKQGRTQEIIKPGDIHMTPRTENLLEIGYFSGLIVPIHNARIRRVMAAMGGHSFLGNINYSFVLRGESGGGSAGFFGRFWSFIGYIDGLLGESGHLPLAMGLGEQMYRLVAIALFEQSGVLESLQSCWCSKSNDWHNQLDELVDYIKENAHLGLTLTDLEEQSHYSTRHLQSLFRQKFDCAPMQFVRRQRLTSAMEKLQTADYDATVTSIGRDCGYRFTSNFTADFHRQFGVTPSTVLRASRGGEK